MKTIIFSDTHLTNNFDLKQFKAIKKIVSKADNVIINGDFWDGFFISFDMFVESEWKNLFPILKDKNTSYIFGNHDLEEMVDERTKLFSDEKSQIKKMSLGDTNLHIEHGHNILPNHKDNPGMYHPARPHFKVNELIQKKIEHFLTKITKTHFFTQFNNNRIKKRKEDLLEDHEILVTGHTHRPEFSPEEKYLNSGMLRFGVLQYIEITDDHIELKLETY